MSPGTHRVRSPARARQSFHRPKGKKKWAAPRKRQPMRPETTGSLDRCGDEIVTPAIRKERAKTLRTFFSFQNIHNSFLVYKFKSDRNIETN